jgi:hypothetical protein
MKPNNKREYRFQFGALGRFSKEKDRSGIVVARTTSGISRQ